MSRKCMARIVLCKKKRVSVLSRFSRIYHGLKYQEGVPPFPSNFYCAPPPSQKGAQLYPAVSCIWCATPLYRVAGQRRGIFLVILTRHVRPHPPARSPARLLSAG